MGLKNEYFRKIYRDYYISCGCDIKKFDTVFNLFIPWLKERDMRDIRLDHILEFIDYLKNDLGRYGNYRKDRTVSCYISYLKGFFDFLYINEYILVNPMCDFLMPKSKNNMKRVIFTQEEINAFLDSIDIDDYEGQRNRAIFELMYSSGLRSSEVINLCLKDINFDDRILLVREGKGKKDRYIPFSDVALKFLLNYMNKGRKKYLKSCKKEYRQYLFLKSKYKLYHAYLAKLFRGYLVKSGVKKKGLSLHSIRHSCASHLLESGAGIRYVQELLGHEDINTTQIYTSPIVESIKRIYKMHHPRENEYYQEIDSEYLREVNFLKEELILAKKAFIRKKNYCIKN